MKQLVKALFGAALLLAFASCSNSSDNSAMPALLAQGGGSGSSPTEITWSAKAEARHTLQHRRLAVQILEPHRLHRG